MRATVWGGLLGISLLALGGLGAAAAPQAGNIPFTGVVIDSNNPGNPHNKTIGDIDGDGFLDGVVASSNGGGMYWYEFPNWTKHAIRTSGSWSTDMQVGDVDGDGDLDVITPKGGSGGTVVWYENPRPGGNPRTSTWTESTIGSQRAHDLEVGDVDNDGDLDVFARGGGSTVLFRQNSPTSWTRKVINSSGGEGTALGDIDRDGDLDVVQNGYWLEAPADKINGTWTRRNLPGSWPTQVGAHIADLNKDGRVDIILAPSESSGRLSWYVAPSNPKTGTWVENVIDSSVSYFHTFKTGDVDKDGDIDIVTAEMHQSSNADEVSVYRNSGNGSSWSQQVVATTGSHNIRLVDIDSDGDLDIFGANWNDSSPDSAVVRYWRNDSDSSLSLDSWQRYSIDAAAPWQPVFVQSADLDGDGRKDIVAGGWWYRNPGSAGGTWTRNTIGGTLYNMAAVYDFDGDGDPDILGTRGKPNSNLFSWGRNNGSGSFTILTNIQAGDGDFLQGVAVDRFSPGGPIEIALSWHAGGKGVQMLTVPSSPSTGTWSWRTIHTSSQDEALSAGDIDRDGDVDLFQGTKWLRNDGATWTQFTISGVGGNPDRNRLADINRDGRLDAVVGFEGSSTTLYWLEAPSNPTNTWTSRTIATGNAGGYSMDVADMDGDGDIDAILGEHQGGSSNRVIIYENGNNGSSWTPHIVDSGGSGIDHHDGTRPVDIDNDGDVDILSIGWYNDKVWLYENQAQTGSANSPPTVNLTAPANGSSFTEGSDITLTANASDSDGTVSKVEFFQNGSKIGEDTSSAGGWTFTWNNVPAGSYTLTARATDNGGASTTSSGAAITVTASTNSPPTVSITAPSNGATFNAGDDVTITATASDSDGSVSKVEFFQGAVKLGEDTNGADGWSFTWNSVLTGSYSLTAVATDDGGASSTSGPVAITVTGSGGGTVPSNGLQIWFRADAGVTTSGSSVSQWADQSGNGRTASQGTASSRPTLVAGAVNGLPAVQFDGSNDFLTFTYPVNGLSEMTLVLVSACTQDQTGGGSNAQNSAVFWDETTSWGTVYLSPFQTNVKFRFGTTQTGNLPAYTRPASLGSSYSISVSEKDGTTDSLYVNGTLVVSEGSKLSTIAGCTDTGYVGRGHNNTYFPGLVSEVLVYSRALTDSERQALEQYLDTRYFSSGNTPPTVSITSPAGGATFTAPANITVAANASDTDGSVTQVEFFQGTTSLGTDTDGSNGWSVSWNGVGAGTYSLTAVATDNGGASTTSSPVSLTVSPPPDTLPSVSFTNPANGATVSGTVGVSAQANDPDAGTNNGDGIADVAFELRQGTTVIASFTDSSAPFDWSLDTLGFADGTYTLRAVATSTAAAGGGSSTATIGITIFNATSGVPPPWQNQDIGAVGVPGSGTFSGGIFTLTASGADIWGTADAFHFVHQPLSGDGQIWARVASLQNTHAWAKAGVMIRESLAADSVNAMMVVTPGNGLSFQRRLATGGSSFSTPGGAASAPYWVRLARSGNTITAYASADGLTWSLVATETIAMATDVEIGLVLTSHDNTVSGTADFDNVVVDTGIDSDGDGMSDSVEVAFGYDPFDGDQDASGAADGLDDWDNDGIDNQTEIAQGTFPGIPPAPGGGGPPGGGGGGGGSSGGCGATGLEALLLLGALAFRRRTISGAPR